MATKKVLWFLLYGDLVGILLLRLMMGGRKKERGSDRKKEKLQFVSSVFKKFKFCYLRMLHENPSPAGVHPRDLPVNSVISKFVFPPALFSCCTCTREPWLQANYTSLKTIYTPRVRCTFNVVREKLLYRRSAEHRQQLLKKLNITFPNAHIHYNGYLLRPQALIEKIHDRQRKRQTERQYMIFSSFLLGVH